MASSSERSPPPFPDSEDQDVLDSEEVRGRDSDEDDLFMSAVSPNVVRFHAIEPAMDMAKQKCTLSEKVPVSLRQRRKLIRRL